MSSRPPEPFRGHRENIRANLPRILASPPALELRGLRRGHLGVAVGAGPSLRKSGSRLLSPPPGVTVVTCDRAYEHLGRADVVVSSDAGGIAGWPLRDPARTHQVALGCVFGAQAYPETVRAWRGPTWWIMAQQTAGMVEAESALAASRCAVTVGAGTVLADCVMVCVLLGCNPIVLAGADCSYDEVTHASGGAAVAGGRGVRTTRSLLLYARELERLAAGLSGIGVTVLNASEAGLLHLGGVIPRARLGHALAHRGAGVGKVGPVEIHGVEHAA